MKLGNGITQFRAMLLASKENAGRTTDEQRPQPVAAPQPPAAPEIREPVAPVKKQELYVPAQATAGSVRCDLHPLYLLREVFIQISLPDSASPTKSKASCCTKENCTRHYIPEFGYFPLENGEQGSFGDLTEKPKCDRHESGYMVVAKIKGEFLWACPEPQCSNTIPYLEASPGGKPA